MIILNIYDVFYYTIYVCLNFEIMEVNALFYVIQNKWRELLWLIFMPESGVQYDRRRKNSGESKQAV